MGTRRSSSSRRGNAFAVRCDSVQKRINQDTSRAALRFVENSATIRLCCSERGRYAFPSLRKTFRFSTRSGTRSKSTYVVRLAVKKYDYLEEDFRINGLLSG
jgi:hypothetical protein